MRQLIQGELPRFGGGVQLPRPGQFIPRPGLRCWIPAADLPRCSVGALQGTGRQPRTGPGLRKPAAVQTTFPQSQPRCIRRPSLPRQLCQARIQGRSRTVEHLLWQLRQPALQRLPRTTAGEARRPQEGRRCARPAALQEVQGQGRGFRGQEQLGVERVPRSVDITRPGAPHCQGRAQAARRGLGPPAQPHHRQQAREGARQSKQLAGHQRALGQQLTAALKGPLLLLGFLGPGPQLHGQHSQPRAFRFGHPGPVSPRFGQMRVDDAHGPLQLLCPGRGPRHHLREKGALVRVPRPRQGPPGIHLRRIPAPFLPGQPGQAVVSPGKAVVRRGRRAHVPGGPRALKARRQIQVQGIGRPLLNDRQVPSQHRCPGQISPCQIVQETPRRRPGWLQLHGAPGQLPGPPALSCPTGRRQQQPGTFKSLGCFLHHGLHRSPRPGIQQLTTAQGQGGTSRQHGQRPVTRRRPSPMN